MPVQLLLSVLSSLGLAVVIVTLGWIADHGATSVTGIVLAAAALASVLATAALPGRIAEVTAGARLRTRAETLRRVLRAERLPDSGQAVGVLADDVERTAVYRGTFLGPMLGSLVAPVLVLVLIGAVIDPLSAIVLGGCALVIPFAVRGFLALTRSSSGAYRRSAAQLSGLILDAIRGLATLSHLSAAEGFERRIARRAAQLQTGVMRVLAVSQSIIIVIDLSFVLFFTAGATGLALWRLDAGIIGPGQAVSLVLLSLVLSEPIDRVGQFFYQGASGRAAEKKVQDLQRLTVPYASPEAAGGAAPGGEAIRAEGIGVAGEDGTPVLQDLSLSVPAGSTIGIVGRSGAGKTTLLRVLAGLQQPSAGHVFIGGRPLGEDIAASRERIAAVSQEAGVLDASIAENLRLAAPEASDEELWEALERAQLAAEARSMPQGLDTRTGEGGSLLSGGQRSRLAIARALLRNAEVLLLDEPTAHLDPESEARVSRAVRESLRGRTAIVVSHREAALEGADAIYALEHGKLVRR